jgi:hypothetical protein
VARSISRWESQVRKEDGAGTNRLWPIARECPRVCLRPSPCAATRLAFDRDRRRRCDHLALGSALLLATFVGSGATASIVSEFAEEAARTSLSLALPGTTAMGFSRSSKP